MPSSPESEHRRRSATGPAELMAPSGAPPRYGRLPLPAYRHVPGLTPHPVGDPRGHAYGVAEPAASGACRSLPESWRECGEYLYGVDLFNRAFLWEAHEAWEIAWKAAGPDGVPGRFLQGLIQIAASLLRRHLGTPNGARRLLRKADKRFDDVEGSLPIGDPAIFMGVELPSWRTAVREYVFSRAAEAYPFLRLDL